jgi:hypothetical protein
MKASTQLGNYAYIFHHSQNITTTTLNNVTVSNIHTNEISIVLTNSSLIQFTVFNSTMTTNTSLDLSGNFTDGTWRHFCFIANTNGTAYGYINGVLSQTVSSGFIFPLTVTRNYMSIGRTYYDGGVTLNGNMDDFRLYNRVLTSLEITNIYSLAYDNFSLTALGMSNFYKLNCASINDATKTEINYLSGTLSNIQSQIDLKANNDAPIFTGDITTDSINLKDAINLINYGTGLISISQG